MGKFEYEKFRVQIKLALSRIMTLQQKHQNSLCGRRKEVGDLLKAGHEERARLLVKYLVRDDYLAEVYEIIQMMLDDLLRSSMYIAQEKTCDPGLAPIVKSIIYAAGRVDVPELLRIKEQLLTKFGRDWAEQAQAGADQKLVFKLGVRHPDNALVSKYLQAIADCYGIPFTAAEEEDEEVEANTLIQSQIQQVQQQQIVQPQVQYVPPVQPASPVQHVQPVQYVQVQPVQPVQPVHYVQQHVVQPPVHQVVHQVQSPGHQVQSPLQHVQSPVQHVQTPPAQPTVYTPVVMTPPPAQPDHRISSVVSDLPPPSYDSLDSFPSTSAAASLASPPPPQQPDVATTSVQTGSPAESRTVPDFDELTRRFESLKSGRKN